MDSDGIRQFFIPGGVVQVAQGSGLRSLTRSSQHLVEVDPGPQRLQDLASVSVGRYRLGGTQWIRFHALAVSCSVSHEGLNYPTG